MRCGRYHRRSWTPSPMRIRHNIKTLDTRHDRKDNNDDIIFAASRLRFCARAGRSSFYSAGEKWYYSPADDRSAAIPRPGRGAGEFQRFEHGIYAALLAASETDEPEYRDRP